MFTEAPARRKRTITGRILGSSLVDLLTGPHGVDRYTEIVNPVWTLDDARAEVVDVTRQTARSVTLVLRPNRAFPGFQAGQHINLQVEIDGRRHTRCYSPANAQHDELIELTIGRHDRGLVSNFLFEHARPGMVVGLDGVGGDFVLGGELPERIVFVSGGSGITPVLSMLRTLRAQDYAGEVEFLHYARTAAETLYRDEHITRLYTREGDPHFSAATVDTDAAVFVCGPPALVAAVRAVAPHAQSESFVGPAYVMPAGGRAAIGRITFAGSGVAATDDGRSLLEQAEAAGLTPASGCRMGICHTCTCRKTSGAVRNLITGAVSAADDEDLQICVSVPVGDVELAI